jgi:hypothetical protein
MQVCFPTLPPQSSNVIFGLNGSPGGSPSHFGVRCSAFGVPPVRPPISLILFILSFPSRLPAFQIPSLPGSPGGLRPPIQLETTSRLDGGTFRLDGRTSRLVAATFRFFIPKFALGLWRQRGEAHLHGDAAGEWCVEKTRCRPAGRATPSHACCGRHPALGARGLPAGRCFRFPQSAFRNQHAPQADLHRPKPGFHAPLRGGHGAVSYFRANRTVRES